MTLQPIPSKFPYIGGTFRFLFYQRTLSFNLFHTQAYAKQPSTLERESLLPRCEAASSKGCPIKTPGCWGPRVNAGFSRGRRARAWDRNPRGLRMGRERPTRDEACCTGAVNTVESSVADLWHCGVDPDPAIFVIGLQDANTKLIYWTSFSVD